VYAVYISEGKWDILDMLRDVILKHLQEFDRR
jgi:hypothetical protein